MIFIVLLLSPDTSKAASGLELPIPTLPLPLTNSILEEAGESIRSRLSEDAPEMCREADGEVVPMPILPLGMIRKRSVNVPALDVKNNNAPELFAPERLPAILASKLVVL